MAPRQATPPLECKWVYPNNESCSYDANTSKGVPREAILNHYRDHKRPLVKCAHCLWIGREKGWKQNHWKCHETGKDFVCHYCVDAFYDSHNGLTNHERNECPYDIKRQLNSEFTLDAQGKPIRKVAAEQGSTTYVESKDPLGGVPEQFQPQARSRTPPVSRLYDPVRDVYK